MPHLPPPPSAPALPAPPTAALAGAASPVSSGRFLRNWERTAFLRSALLSLLATGAGVFLLRALLPLLSAETVTAICRAHLSPLSTGGWNTLLMWLGLILRRLPAILLLATAGMTRFSGALTSGVLIWRGASDGATGYLLYALWRGDFALTDASGMPAPSRWLAVFAATALVASVLRVILSAEARRLASALSAPAGITASPLSRDELRERLWWYAVVFLAVIGGVMLTDGVYVILL